jgi:hypothetical protein
MEDIEDNWMLLLKDTDDFMKEGVLHIIFKVRASFKVGS